MAKWNTHNNCYSYAIDYPDKWMLINDNNYKQGVQTLLEANPNFRRVRRNEMVLGKEYVAYRFGKTDFHFMKRGKDGHWRHKMGWSNVEAISTKLVFDKVWNFSHYVYSSKLYLFEVQ